jgi:hypothetical protein
VVDDVLDQRRCPVVALDDLAEPRPLEVGLLDRRTGASSGSRRLITCGRNEAGVRSHERSERRGRVVHDLDALPQLADRPSSLRWCHREPRLVEVLAPYLLSHDPVVTLDRAHAKDLWVSDLVRQNSDERDLGGHVDGCVRDPHGDPVTDPGRVRVPACPMHPVEVTAVLGA